MMSVRVPTEPSFVPGTPEVLFRDTYFGLGGGRNYDVAQDGQRFLMIKAGGGAEDTSGKEGGTS